MEAGLVEDSNVPDYLRERFARLNIRLDDVARWQVGTGRRLVAIERHLAAVRRDAVLNAEDVVTVRESVAALADRVERLSRLDIAS